MFSIGEFARLGAVSVRTLRHYDEIGLLHPAKVDPNSGYRSYAADQLGQLNRIMALKDLGFSLEQTHKLVSGITLEELRGMLALRRAQLEQALDEYTTRLRGVEARLRYLALPVAEPPAELPPPAQYLVLPAIEAATAVRNGKASSIYPAVYHDLVHWCGANGFQTSGPGRDIWIHEIDDVSQVEEQVFETQLPFTRPEENQKLKTVLSNGRVVPATGPFPSPAGLT